MDRLRNMSDYCQRQKYALKSEVIPKPWRWCWYLCDEVFFPGVAWRQITAVCISMLFGALWYSNCRFFLDLEYFQYVNKLSCDEYLVGSEEDHQNCLCRITCHSCVLSYEH